jgi:hypothetical protein
MHYKNGRQVVIGDKVIVKDWNDNIVSGIVVKVLPTADTCNILISPINPNGILTFTASEALHIDDSGLGPPK